MLLILVLTLYLIYLLWLQLLHQLIATPIHYDFYNYESEDKEFTQLFIKFTQVREVTYF